MTKIAKHANVPPDWELLKHKRGRPFMLNIIGAIVLIFVGRLIGWG